MTQEYKQLLIKDLCARLPYGVMVKLVYDEKTTVTREMGLGSLHDIMLDNAEGKPYLRPMSSMTEDERNELSDYLCERVMSDKTGITIPPNPIQGKGISFEWMQECINWLILNHFDYRGLIPKGLALPATENMYTQHNV